MADVPEEMKRNGRPEDPHFDDNEKLDRRLPPGFLEGWGVFGFEVQHIPAELLQDGVTKYTFGPRHRPLKNNYPHSEVWAFRDGRHIDAKNSDLLLDPEAHQRWRQRLAWKCRIVIRPDR
jgi:hypothetical protein